MFIVQYGTCLAGEKGLRYISSVAEKRTWRLLEQDLVVPLFFDKIAVKIAAGSFCTNHATSQKPLLAS